jgi:hypothetical protein
MFFFTIISKRVNAGAGRHFLFCQWPANYLMSCWVYSCTQIMIDNIYFRFWRFLGGLRARLLCSISIFISTPFLSTWFELNLGPGNLFLSHHLQVEYIGVEYIGVVVSLFPWPPLLFLAIEILQKFEVSDFDFPRINLSCYSSFSSTLQI